MSSRTPETRECLRRDQGAVVLLVAALLAFASSGCAATSLVHMTPVTPELAMNVVYPVAVDYQLLDFVTGQACEDLDILEKMPGTKSPNAEPGTGHPVVYQAAKYDALEKADAADNLISIRVKVEEDKKQQCVTLTGRAYRITSVEATPPGTTVASSRLGLSRLSTGGKLARNSRSSVSLSSTRAAAKPRALNQLYLLVGAADGMALSAGYSRQGRYLTFELGATVLVDYEDLVPYTRLSVGYAFMGWLYPYVSVSGGYYIDDEDPYLAIGAGVDVRRRGVGVRLHTEAIVDGGVTFVVGPTFNF